MRFLFKGVAIYLDKVETKDKKAYYLRIREDFRKGKKIVKRTILNVGRVDKNDLDTIKEYETKVKNYNFLNDLKNEVLKKEKRDDLEEKLDK